MMCFTLEDIEEIVTCIIECELNKAEAKDYIREFLADKKAQSYKN